MIEASSPSAADSPCYNEISPPAPSEIWCVPGRFLRADDYPILHDRLVKSGRRDLAWKIDACRHDAIRLDCSESPHHSGFIPVSCNRRICPACALGSMSRAIQRYQPIALIASRRDQDAGGRRVRFWTHTCRTGRRDLRSACDALCKAYRLWCRRSFGRSASTPDPEAGGLAVLEIGPSRNPHIHSLIDSRYLVTAPGGDAPVSPAVRDWRHCLQQYGLDGWIVDARALYGSGPDAPMEVYERAIVETISYPLNPEGKHADDIPHDELQRLLADVELALSGRQSTSTRAIRRMWTWGNWYNRFPAPANPGCMCPECRDWTLSREPSYDVFHGRGFRRGWFNDTKEGESRWQNRITNQKIGTD